MNSITVVLFAHGHPNILATHKTTFEVTTEKTLTKQGDCIVAIEATKAAINLPLEFKERARKKEALIKISIQTNETEETIKAYGDPKLQFTHPTDLVVRKSNYICGRTLAIRAEKAAIDFSRKLVEKLRNPNQSIKIKLTVENY